MQGEKEGSQKVFFWIFPETMKKGRMVVLSVYLWRLFVIVTNDNRRVRVGAESLMFPIVALPRNKKKNVYICGRGLSLFLFFCLPFPFSLFLFSFINTFLL